MSNCLLTVANRKLLIHYERVKNIPDYGLDINHLLGQSSNFHYHFPGNQENINASATYDDLVRLVSIRI